MTSKVARAPRPGAKALLALIGLAAAACAAPRAPSSPAAERTPAQARGAAADPGPPASGLAVGDLAGPLRLDRLLPILLERSPSIRQARARLRAARERYPQAIALPDPMVEATWYARNAMFPDGGGPGRWNLMLRQEMPFPTVLRLRGQGALMEAQAEAVRYEASVRDAVTQLRDVHAERAYLVEAEQVTQAVLAIYLRLAELARSGEERGRTTLPESFRAEALAGQAGYDLVVVRERRAVEDARLGALLDLPADSVLGAPADAAESYDLRVADADLSSLAERHNQELRVASIDTQVAEVGARRARWELAPSLDLGVGVMRNDEFDELLGRGEDSVVLTLGFTLPVGNPGRHAAVREADANAVAARASETERRQRLRADVARAAYRVRNSARLAALYGDILIPQAEQALASSREMVSEGKESLASSLELAAAWQAMKIARARAVADNAQAAVALERLLGTTLATAPQEGTR